MRVCICACIHSETFKTVEISELDLFHDFKQFHLNFFVFIIHYNCRLHNTYIKREQWFHSDRPSSLRRSFVTDEDRLSNHNNKRVYKQNV